MAVVVILGSSLLHILDIILVVFVVLCQPLSNSGNRPPSICHQYKAGRSRAQPCLIKRRNRKYNQLSCRLLLLLQQPSFLFCGMVLYYYIAEAASSDYQTPELAREWGCLQNTVTLRGFSTNLGTGTMLLSIDTCK